MHSWATTPTAGRTARAAVFRGVGQPLALETLPVADPETGEILVRVLGCTLCGSDVHSYLGRRSTPLPTILGHEVLGRIEAFGPGPAPQDARGRPLGRGDRVTWSIVASCGSCFYCRRGLPQKCLRAIKYGHKPLQENARLRGGLAETCLLAPGTSVVRLDERLSDEAACPANCGTATMVAAIEAAGALRERCVVVIGAGLLGLTACGLARHRGAADVILCDPQSARLRRGETFGATLGVAPGELPAAVAATTQGQGADVVIDVAGTPQAFELALPLLRLGAILLLVGAVFPAPAVPLPVERIVRRNLQLVGIHNYRPEHLVGAVEFLETSEYPWGSLVAEWLQLGVYPMEAVVVVDDTPVGIEAGLNAGAWTVAVVRSGNALGLSWKATRALEPDELRRRLERAAVPLMQAGAHLVIDSIAELPPCIEEIEHRLQRGEKP